MPDIGQTILHYRILEMIGVGGMGEVYKAKDQKLGRDVAIKVLPEEFAKDTDRVARFQREAKLLASLNHPNIAAIHGLEESEGTHFLVLELIEGDTLADRLKHGAIPVEESLKLALQIAEALEAAHEKGVIHRDLKPANIKVTLDGKVKVLDFGLAKAFAGEQAEVNLSHSPTLSDMATQQGVILGTAAYMSPEQARGKPVDKRADIWALGCVLYEMLTGRIAFQGEDVTEILAAVVKSGVNLDSLPANIHPRVRELLTRCLQKDQKKRYSGIGDVQYEIEQVLADPSGSLVQPIPAVKPRKKMRVGISWIAVTAILSVIIAGVAVWYLKAPEPRQVVRFDYELPENQQFTNTGRSVVAVSPDGSRIVYVANQRLYLRNVEQQEERPILGTDEVPVSPFFSADSQWIGYFCEKDMCLKKIAVNGGVPVSLCNCQHPFGGSWGANDKIVFGQSTGIMRVSANGGTPELLIKTGENEHVHGPQILPDGEWILFAVTEANGPSRWDQAQIVAQSLKTGERKTLFSGGCDASYAPTGHLIYALRGALFAAPFDADNLKVTGGGLPVIEGVERAVSPQTNSGTANYGFSEQGMLAYVPGGVEAISKGNLVWVSRDGKEEPIEAPPEVYSFPRISPDGRLIALTEETSANSDIWILDLFRKTMTRLTFDEGEDSYPVWSPDGKRIAFHSSDMGVAWKAADGTGDVESFGVDPNQSLYPASWSRDGKTLLLAEVTTGSSIVDVVALTTEGDHATRPLLTGNHDEYHPQLSPDGKWVAYVSTESGRGEIYVRPFPEVNKGGRWQISNENGDQPVWSPDGRELFYRSGDSMMVVSIEREPSFRAGLSKKLFQGIYLTGLGQMYDISPDGKRFLMIKESTSGTSTEGTSRPRINIVLNWFEELKDKVAAD